MANHPTLIPIDEADINRPLLALDVDGVLNQFLPTGATGIARRRVRTAHGRKYLIDFDPAVIDALDTVVRNLGVEIGWLTTWGPNVRALVEQAFDGKLAGGYILRKQPARYRGAIPGDWKRVGLTERLAVTGQRWVWVDDEAIGMAWLEPGQESEVAAAPGLFLPTDPVTGLTLAQVAQIEAFARG